MVPAAVLQLACKPKEPRPMQFGSHESLEDYVARENACMTLVEMLRNPQRVEGGALDTAFNQRVMMQAADEIERLTRGASDV
jgi:hypothetical protein